MARPKSLLVSLELTIAERRHACRQDKSHLILKGVKRLTIRSDDGPQHYCLECASKFVSRDLPKLQSLRDQLQTAIAEV